MNQLKNILDNSRNKLLEVVSNRVFDIRNKYFKKEKNIHIDQNEKSSSDMVHFLQSSDQISQIEQVKHDYEEYHKTNESQPEELNSTYQKDIEDYFKQDDTQNVDFDRGPEIVVEATMIDTEPNLNEEILQKDQLFQTKDIEITNASDHLVPNIDKTDQEYIHQDPIEEVSIPKPITQDNLSEPVANYSIIDDETNAPQQEEPQNINQQDQVTNENKPTHAYYNSVDDEVNHKYEYEYHRKEELDYIEDDTSEEHYHTQEAISDLPTLSEIVESEDHIHQKERKTIDWTKVRSKNNSLTFGLFGKSNSKYLPYFASFTIVLFLVVFFTAYSIFSNDQSVPPNIIAEDNTEQESVTQSVQGISNTQYQDENRIAYVSNYNVWLVDQNGANKLQITRDGDKYSPYENIVWRRSGIVGFSKCQGDDCSIYSYEIMTENLVQEIQITTSDINDFVWADDYLLIFYTRPDGRMELIRNKQGEEKVLYTFNNQSTNSISPNDRIIINYEYGKVSVVNTVAAEVDDKFVLMDIDGEVISSIDNGLLDINFVDNSSFYYIYERNLYQSDINSIHSDIVFDGFASIASDISPSREFIASSNIFDDSLYIFDTKTQTNTLQVDNFYGVTWVDNSNVVGFRNVSENLQTEVNQIAKYNLISNSVVQLVLDAVSEYKVE